MTSNTEQALAGERSSPAVTENQTRAAGSTPAGTTTWTLVLSLLMGTYFGIVLTKSEVVRWQRVHDMFLFKEPHMYLIIGTGVGLAMILMLIIKRFKIYSMLGQPITYRPKPFHLGTIFGGTIFGAGWAVAGACPGPIYAQIGAGAWMGLITLTGALLGMFLYAGVESKLPR